MQRTTKHMRLFRLVYNSPDHSDIAGGIDIRVRDIAAVCATKALAFSIAYPHAAITSLTRISRVNNNEFNPCSFGFVFEKGPQLSKSPRVMPSPLRLPDSGSSSDMGQVLYGDPFSFGHGQINDFFADSVIDDSGMSVLAPFKPFQKLLASFCAFALTTSTHLKLLVSYFIQVFRPEACSVGKSCDVHDTKINADKVFYVFDIIFGNFDCLKQIPLAFLGNKIGFAFNIRKISWVMANKRYFQPACNGPNRHRIRPIGKNPAIISDASERLKCSFGFPVELIGINNLGYTSDNHLSGKVEIVPHCPVNKAMEFEPVESHVGPCSFGNLITCAVRLFKGIQKRVRLFVGRQKLYLQRQFHGFNYIHPAENVNTYFQAAIPPLFENRGFLAGSL